MRTRLTLQAGGGLICDVEVRAPAGTTLAAIRATLAGHAGRPAAADATVWAGSRALPDAALLGGPGLRSGCVVGIGSPGQRDHAAQAVLRLHVVSGPDAGLVAGLPRGLVCIGRAPDCDVRLSDCDVSRHHLELTVTARGISVRDLDSTNGSQLLSDDGSAGESLDRDGAELRIDRHVSIGETILCVAAVAVPAAATSLDGDGSLVVNRQPRLGAQLPPREVAFDAPPRGQDRPALPWLAALLPAVGGAGLAWFLHNPQFLAFALLSPVLMLSTSLGERLSGRRGRRRERVHARRRESERRKDLRELARAETRFRRAAHPDPAALLHTATTPDARVWERRPSDPDFLDVRLGLSDRPATFTVRRGGQPEPVPTLAAVPLTADLRTGPLGICGPRPLALALARWLIGQIVTLHSPADVAVAALLADDAGSTWSWLRWLPHLPDGIGTGRGGSTWIARTDEHRQSLVSRLSALAAQRSGRHRSADRPWDGPWVVVVVDRAAQHAGLAGIGRLLKDGPAVGITAICVDDEARRLPPACTSVAGLTGESGTRVRLRTAAGEHTQAITERVSRSWVEQVARALCPLRDPGGDTATALPQAARLLDLLDGSLDEESVRARWSAGAGAPRTVLGVCADGPLGVDLARDGPHALVAGTTGAGKSELLQTLVAGLAVHAGPADLQFVLIDYKGGAAFADCARLPHTSGLVTDLDGHLTERALRSLDAELTRRETLFAAAAVSDLAGYRRSARHRDDPLGRLVLVVDEFAALAEELPDFVTGLVGIAQRGRSLGVHLVLATQRPGGVVSAEIRANTGLRIALRVTDPADSSDVIGCDDAARIDKTTPGRAVLRTGTSLTSLQAARVGGAPPPAGPPIEVVALDEWGAVLGQSDPAAAQGPTDLRLLVDSMRAAAGTTRLPPRPWLDPVPDVVDVGTLAGAAVPFVVPFGLVDRPDRQLQLADTLDLSAGASMLFAGGPRSGRSSALRTIAAQAASQLTAAELHLHVIDCAGGSLRAIAELPHCGSMITRDSPAGIDRLLNRLTEEVTQRHTLLAERGVGTVAEARAGGHALAAIVLLLDGWEGFLAATEEIDAGRPVDTLLRLLRDGTAAGLTVLLAGGRSALATRLASAVQRRLVLRLSDPDDYTTAGLSRRAVPGRMPAGRALDCADAGELQLAVLGPDPTTAAQLSVVHRIAACTAAARPGCGPFVVRSLPARIRLGELSVPDDGSAVVIGAGGDDAGAVAVTAIGADAHFLVAGPARSGRSTVLVSLATQLAGRDVRVVAAAGTRSPLPACAERLGVQLVGAGSNPACPVASDVEAAARAGEPVVLLVDDCEQFTDTRIGDWVAGLIRAAPPGLAVFACGRSDDLAVSYRGIGAEIRRAGTGLLLQPGPGDGDLFGVRLPFGRSAMPVGRGYLIADELVTPESRSANRAVAIQVALP